MNYTNKKINFAHELVPLIINGSKTLTYRVGDKYRYLKVGDTIPIADSSTNKTLATVAITKVSSMKFADLPINTKGHETYSSKVEQKNTFKNYYGRTIQNNEEVLVLGFKVVKLFDQITN